MVIMTELITENKSRYNVINAVLSLSMIVYLIVGIDKECMECNIFACLETHLTRGFSQKTDLNALVKL